MYRPYFVRLFLSYLLPVVCLPVLFWAPSPSAAQVATPAPIITQVDPPNWWTGLPSPMLLLRGQGLLDATFTSNNHSVSIEHTQISANGHWAFLWLDTKHARPQTLRITAHTQAGTTRFLFPLQQRHAAPKGSQGFSSKDAMYLIMPDRFADGDLSNDRPANAPGTYDRSNPRAYHGGDLRGIQQHLDYIQKLGMTTIWTTPLDDNDNHSPQDYHGYGAVNLYNVDEHFGTIDDYIALAKAVHQRGMKLVLDTVPNHVGPRSPWVLDPPAPDWFHGTLQHHIQATGDFVSITDPHAPPADRIPVVDGWFANILPDLDQSNPLVEQYLIQNAVWWTETAQLDGLRLDTFPYVDRKFWHDFHAELHAIYPRLTTVGEVFNSDPTIVSYFAGGVERAGIDTGLDTPFDYPMFFAIRATLAKDRPMTALQQVLRQDWLYPHPERLVTFLGNHDTKRFISEDGATPARMQLAFGLLATLRGMPQIYAGDELAMPGGDDPDNRHDFPGGFPGDTHNAFLASGRTPAQAAMHDWVEGIFQLRAKHPALQSGSQQDLLADDTGFVFARIAGAQGTGNGETLLVLLNKSGKARTFDLDLTNTALENTTALTPVWNTHAAVTVAQKKCHVPVGPEQIVVLRAVSERPSR
jgi:glycosidase